MTATERAEASDEDKDTGMARELMVAITVLALAAGLWYLLGAL